MDATVLALLEGRDATQAAHETRSSEYGYSVMHAPLYNNVEVWEDMRGRHLAFIRPHNH